jgi:hypothetical protein
VDRLRTICFAFPEVTERLSRGERVWFVRSRKLFVTCADHHHDDRRGLWCVPPEGARGVLGISQPERCFVSPYVAIGAGLVAISS